MNMNNDNNPHLPSAASDRVAFSAGSCLAPDMGAAGPRETAGLRRRVGLELVWRSAPLAVVAL